MVFGVLYKRSVYWLLVVLLMLLAASTLTLINNAEFYKFAEVDARSDVKKNAVVVNQYASLCMEQYNDVDRCVEKEITRFLGEINRSSYYRMHFILKDRGGVVRLDQDDRRDRHKDREPIKLSDIAPQQQNIESLGLMLEIVSNVKPSLFISIYNAITCNHIDGCNSGGSRIFYKFLALSFVVLSVVLILLNKVSRAHEDSKLRLIDERDQVEDKLRLAQDGVNSLRDDLSAAEELLDEESNITGRSTEKIQLLTEQLEEKDLQVMQLKEDLRKRDAIVDQYAQREDQSSRRKMFKKFREILTRNPKIKTTKIESINVNPGKHHGKDFVKEIMDQLMSTDGLSEYGCSVTSDKYDDKHRNTCTVYQDENLGRYCVKVVGDGDAGFAAKITFAVEKRHEVLMLMKYVVATNKHFKKYSIRVR